MFICVCEAIIHLSYKCIYIETVFVCCFFSVSVSVKPEYTSQAAQVTGPPLLAAQGPVPTQHYPMQYVQPPVVAGPGGVPPIYPQVNTLLTHAIHNISRARN